MQFTFCLVLFELQKILGWILTFNLGFRFLCLIDIINWQVIDERIVKITFIVLFLIVLNLEFLLLFFLLWFLFLFFLIIPFFCCYFLEGFNFNLFFWFLFFIVDFYRFGWLRGKLLACFLPEIYSLRKAAVLHFNFFLWKDQFSVFSFFYHFQILLLKFLCSLIYLWTLLIELVTIHHHFVNIPMEFRRVLVPLSF